MDVSMDNSRASSVEPHDVSSLNINENDQKPTKKASISDDEENSNLSSGNFEGDSNKTRQRRGRKAGSSKNLNSNQNKPGNRGDTKSNSTTVHSTFDNRPTLRLGKQSSLEDSGNDVPMTGTLRLVQIGLNMSEIVQICLNDSYLSQLPQRDLHLSKWILTYSHLSEIGSKNYSNF